MEVRYDVMWYAWDGTEYQYMSKRYKSESAARRRFDRMNVCNDTPVIRLYNVTLEWWDEYLLQELDKELVEEKS